MFQHVFILSDGTGRTASHSFNSALVQFSDIHVKEHLRPNVRSKNQISKIISEAFEKEGMIIHSLVSKELRHFIFDLGRLYDLVTIDLMGPLLSQLALQFENNPAEKPGIYSKLNKSYFQRIEAVEFSIRHDDGQRVNELDKADIVLLGVSRTFKTPISIYLAHKGWCVANVPIVLDMPLPPKIYDLDPSKIFCLTTFSKRLTVLRESRDKHLGGLTGQYADLWYVQRELDYARNIFRRQPKWTTIKVTYKPIEEISSEILSKLRKNLTVSL